MDKVKLFENKIIELEKEIAERKRLNEAQIQYRESTHISFCAEVSNALKAEYEDFSETKDMPMNEMLGEIYREKLNHVFKILEQKGIKVLSN